MNWFEQERKKAERIKEQYPAGTRIELISMGNDPRPIESGTRGTVDVVDDLGTIHCNFDNGRCLGVCPGEDSFLKLTEKEIISESNKVKTVDGFEKAKLCIDESSGIFEGYISGRRWNGWECPMFTM